MTAENSTRTAGTRQRGRPFRKGVSGNPGGRPKVLGPIRDLARQHAEEAVAVLLRVMRRGDSDRVRLAAAEALLDRGYGKPVAFDAQGYVDGEIEAVLNCLEVAFADEPAIYERALRAIAQSPNDEEAENPPAS